MREEDDMPEPMIVRGEGEKTEIVKFEHTLDAKKGWSTHKYVMFDEPSLDANAEAALKAIAAIADDPDNKFANQSYVGTSKAEVTPPNPLTYKNVDDFVKARTAFDRAYRPQCPVPTIQELAEQWREARCAEEGNKILAHWYKTPAKSPSEFSQQLDAEWYEARKPGDLRSLLHRHPELREAYEYDPAVRHCLQEGNRVNDVTAGLVLAIEALGRQKAQMHAEIRELQRAAIFNASHTIFKSQVKGERLKMGEDHAKDRTLSVVANEPYILRPGDCSPESDQKPK